jgi:hypothetical protein
MKIPTRNAPQVWLKVFAKIAPSWFDRSFPTAARRAATMIHDAAMAEPPTKGAKLNAAVMVALVSGALATTFVETSVIFGSGDHGPVQSVTTMISTTKGAQAMRSSSRARASAWGALASASALKGMPP